jgi:hypothetical protein
MVFTKVQAYSHSSMPICRISVTSYDTHWCRYGSISSLEKVSTRRHLSSKTLQQDNAHSSDKVYLKEDAATGGQFGKKTPQQKSASARRRLWKIAIAPSHNDLVLASMESDKDDSECDAGTFGDHESYQA